MSVGRTLRTVRHLRAIQITDRLRRRFRRFPARPFDEAAAGLRPRDPVGALDVPHRRAYRDGGFRFLGRRAPFEGPSRWAPDGAEALWIYHLQGFQYLGHVSADVGRTLILDWIREQPPGTAPAWDPYPISLRLREWTEWLLARDDLGREDRREITRSITHQAEALSGGIEYHLLGNHLLENAITLCWIGSSFDGTASDGWLRQGAALLQGELDEQVLADGVHFERSPMYQSMLAEALCRLARVVATCPSPLAHDVCAAAAAAGGRMIRSLRRLSHPDGDLVLFNDSALGHAATVGQLEAAYPDLVDEGPTDPGPAWHLAAAGILGWDDGKGRALVLDAGPLGPDYQPGHGHADTLTFELSVAGSRLVTDTGVQTYEVGPVRDYDRSTRAHNTVELDGRNQAELWGAFRCGRRPRVDGSVLRVTGSASVLEGGFAVDSGRGWIHRRRLSIDHAGLVATDRLRASGAHVARLRLHLAPEVDARQTGAGVELRRDGRRVARIDADDFEWMIARSPYHPTFGREIDRQVLVAEVPVRDRAELRWRLEFA